MAVAIKKLTSVSNQDLSFFFVSIFFHMFFSNSNFTDKNFCFVFLSTARTNATLQSLTQPP